MSQYKIPQKTQRADKIIGPLTAKQLLYAFLTITTAYLLYQTINFNPIIEFNSIEKLIILAPLVVLGAAFTLIEINERPFEIYFAAFLQFILHPRVRIWQKEIPELTYSTTTRAEAEKKEQETAAEPEPSTHVSRAEIERLSQIMDAPESIAPLPKGQSTKTQALLNIVQKTNEDSAPMNVIAKQNNKSLIPSLRFLSSLQGFFFGSNSVEKKKKEKKAAPAPEETAPASDTQAEDKATRADPSPPTPSLPGGVSLSAGFDSKQPATIKNDAAQEASTATETPPKQSVNKFDIKLPSELSIEELIAQAQQNQDLPESS